MPLAAIRAAIKTTLEAVSNIGIVTPYEPLTTRDEDFKRFFFKATLGIVRGWTITREASPETVRNQARVNDRRHLMVIRGYEAVGVDAAGEEAFQDLVETVCDALRVKHNDQLNSTVREVGPPSVRIIEVRKFSDYLVHYAEIAFPLIEDKTF
jgi:hypothetical protein